MSSITDFSETFNTIASMKNQVLKLFEKVCSFLSTLILLTHSLNSGIIFTEVVSYEEDIGSLQLFA